MSIDAEVGRAVRAHMFQTSTQDKVAELLGVSQGTMSRKIHGKSPWRLEELYAVAGVIGCEVTDLLPDINRVTDE